MTAVIIQARMGSSRFPNKTMKMLLNEPMLFYSYKRSKMAKYVDNVIIATTENPSDDLIANWCEKKKIKCFRGSEDNVLKRYYDTAKQFNADRVVRVTSDCPFIDPEIIDLCILTQKTLNKDYVSNRIEQRTWPHGMDLEVFSFDALEKAFKNATEKAEIEHVTPYIRNHPELFTLQEVPYTEDLSNIRLTVDYEEDFKFTEVLLQRLLDKYSYSFNFKNVLQEIELDKEILQINRNRIDAKI